MKKQEFRRGMSVAKRSVTLAAMLFVLNNSFFSTVPVFAKDQVESEANVQNKEKLKEVKSAIDQKVYGNLLKNPTLQINGTTLTDWKIRPGGKNWSVVTTEIGILTVKNPGFKVTFSDNNYNQKPMYLSYELNNLMKIQYKNFGVANVLAMLTFQQQVQTIRNRTYTAEMRASEKSDFPYLGVNFSNKVGYEGDDPYYRTIDIKNNQSSQTVTYFVADNNGDPIYLIRNSLLVKMKYASQWKALDSLFTSLDHTELAQGVTIRDINKVETKIDYLDENKDIKEMNDALNKARFLFEKRAVDAVNALMVNGELAPGVMQESIDQAQELVNHLPEGAQKQALQNQLNQVKELWKIQQQAQMLIENLFQNGQLKPNVSQVELNQAQQLLDKLPPGENKQRLQLQLDKAKKLWEDQKNAQAAVDNLFINGQVKPTISKEEINQAQQLINKLLDGELKLKLQTQLNQAQKVYDQKVLAELTVTINDWFTDTSYSALKDSVTLADVDKVIAKLEEVPEGDNKDMLTQRVVLAQVILNNNKNNMAIKEQVDRLFTDTTYTKLAEGVTCEKVQTVQSSVLNVTDITLRNELKILIEKALSLC